MIVLVRKSVVKNSLGPYVTYYLALYFEVDPNFRKKLYWFLYIDTLQTSKHFFIPLFTSPVRFSP